MLRTILSISGRPGLYKLVSQGRGSLIVESLADGRRSAVHARERVVALASISMYTVEEDVPLPQVLTQAYAHYKGERVDVAQLETVDQIQSAFSNVLPTFDRERVYPSDIKKLFTWYNILIGAGITDFATSEEENTQE